jgi:hypothetical protein
MGLAISVGALAFALEHDPEGAEWLREDFRQVNRLLAAHGLPHHQEPGSLPASSGPAELTFDQGVRRGLWLSGMPYGWLHYLRRAVAFARQAPDGFCPVEDGEDPARDELIDRELFVLFDSHVICHSDCEGFYVPIDFPEPLYDDRDDGVPGGIVGSSQRALQELLQTAPLLGIPVACGDLRREVAAALLQQPEGSHPLWVERYAWLYFFERLRDSVQLRSVVVFG